MAVDMKTLNKLAKFARKNGITNLKVDGIEVSFHAAYLAPGVSSEADRAEPPPAPPQYTDEQILNWSSTTYVEAN